MSDVLAIIANLKARLWDQYGDVLKAPRSQEEVHMTYYAGDLLERHGHKWFKTPGVEGACYTEKAMQDAFTAGHRIGLRGAESIAQQIVLDRIASAHAALDEET